MLNLKRNMSNLDRSIRIIVGIVLLIVGPATNLVKLNMALEIVLAVIGVFAILSAVFAYCLFYEFADIDTQR